jgi:AcrR family transcriptional regulator
MSVAGAGADSGASSASAICERIVSSAYELFSRRGVQAVSLHEVAARSGVDLATLRQHFPTKDDLVLAFLRRREQVWTIELVQRQSHLRGNTPEQRLLAIFDVFHDWFARREDFEGCSFINVLLELGQNDPAGQASIRYLDNIRDIVGRRAQQAGLRDPEEFAHCWHILMKGAIIAAAEGDRQAAHRAKEMGRRLLDHHRQPALTT